MKDLTDENLSMIENGTPEERAAFVAQQREIRAKADAETIRVEGRTVAEALKDGSYSRLRDQFIREGEKKAAATQTARILDVRGYQSVRKKY